MPSGFNLGDRVMAKLNYNTRVGGACRWGTLGSAALGCLEFTSEKCKTNPICIESPMAPRAVRRDHEPNRTQATQGCGCAPAWMGAIGWRRGMCFCRKHAYLQSVY